MPVEGWMTGMCVARDDLFYPLQRDNGINGPQGKEVWARPCSAKKIKYKKGKKPQKSIMRVAIVRPVLSCI